VTRILITGGAGFVGANLAVALAERHRDWEIVALDNLHRAGSELNLPRLQAAGVSFREADVRDRDALGAVEPIDALVECSAEPSALAGMSGDTAYPFETNLVGAYNSLELARRDSARFIFLSTSRIYPYPALNELLLERAETRFELSALQPFAGASRAGISERFPLDGPRTLYGATKLAAELLVAEYAANFDLTAVVDRCGVIAGPWQMGRIDQGVFTYWLLAHHFGRPLTYIGYGGAGHQVRDLLHVDDLVELIDSQLAEPERWRGFVGNVGGGREVSLSLLETTEICRELTGTEMPIHASSEERPGDVPLYISDCSRLHAETAWRPRKRPREVLADILAWVKENEDTVAASLGFES
jgi:CDP-paratose 2-epimerase